MKIHLQLANLRIKEVLAEGNFDRLTETASKLVDAVG